ncbi:TonB-dependent receptor [Thalassotalea atypica]|uniref:TonB-dependent receptor n=1 Tax=Thalassotalea atypica TaxID=2054316 RepID=UPI0025742982|nr:TonB-dependent receptor [Thalassotalea atypica]
MAKTFLSVSIASALMAAPTYAEESGQVAVEDKEIEVIEVRGGQRVQTLREVPASVSVLTGDSLKQMKINKLGDVSQSLPNVSISENAIQDTISIRGVNSDLQAGGEQSVGIFVDGVYHGRGVQSRFSFMDVDAIEVLRGPQGSLFGKNTIGGVISILPAQPTDYLEAKLTAAHEIEFDKTDYSGYVSGALNESGSLTGRLAFQTSETKEGWVENLATSKKFPVQEEDAFRGILNWQINDQFKLNLRVEQGEFENNGASYENPHLNDDFPLTALIRQMGAEDDNDGKNLISNQNYPGLGRNGKDKDYFMAADYNENALKAEYRTEEGTITALLAQSKYDFVRTQDADLGPLPLMQLSETEDYTQDSAELRFVSKDDENFEYLFGAYWQSSELRVDAVTDVATAQGTPVAMQLAALNFAPEYAVTSRLNGLHQDTETLAIFGQVSVGFAENFKLDFAARYSEEEKTGKQFVDVYGGAGDGVKSGSAFSSPAEYYVWSIALLEATVHDTPIEREENLFSPSVSLSWQQSDTANYYASVSKGFKGGGFNSFAMSAETGEIEYENEKAISSEIGAKFEFFDGDLMLNTAIFSVDYEDMQTTLFTGGTTFVVDNAAKATSRGLEAEMRWVLNDNFLLDVNLGYIDFEFEDYTNAGCTGLQIAQSGLNGAACALAGINDLSGKTTQDVPELTMSASLQHEFAFNEYEVISRLDLNYSDEYFATADLDPLTKQDAFTLVNFSASLTSVESNWQADLIVKNITDESYYYYAADMPLFAGSHFASYSIPRTVTVQLSYLFE